jgi:hypothetical protein
MFLIHKPPQFSLPPHGPSRLSLPTWCKPNPRKTQSLPRDSTSTVYPYRQYPQRARAPTRSTTTPNLVTPGHTRRATAIPQRHDAWATYATATVSASAQQIRLPLDASSAVTEFAMVPCLLRFDTSSYAANRLKASRKINAPLPQCHGCWLVARAPIP